MPELLIRVGLDDTDHPDGGCTTYDLNSLSELLRSVLPSYEEVERRLVRLWPYAERRTRGNAALCLLATIEEGDQGALYEALDSWVPEPGDADGTSSARPAIVAGSGDPPLSGTPTQCVPRSTSTIGWRPFRMQASGSSPSQRGPTGPSGPLLPWHGAARSTHGSSSHGGTPPPKGRPGS